MELINIYFRKPPETDRFIPGDRYLIPIIRRLIRGKKVSGIEKVFINLCRGLDELKIKYAVNRPFKSIKAGEPVIVLGIGKYALEGYKQPNPVIAGIGLMTHPAYWPNLCMEYPVAKYLQHSKWANDIYVDYYGAAVCDLWPAGIDTERWSPDERVEKKYDFLVYTKIMWDKPKTEAELKLPLLHKLDQLGFSYRQITYGNYKEAEYNALLQQCSAMIFLCEHESQGFACCEALAMDVPVFAWDQGLWLDPERFKWNAPVVAATSIPFFNDDCGMSFNDYAGFEKKLPEFWSKIQGHSFMPRNYIINNLTLKKSALRMLEIIAEVHEK